MKVTVLNKYSDEISEGIITEIHKNSFVIEGKDEFLFKHVARETLDAATVQLSIAGSWL